MKKELILKELEDIAERLMIKVMFRDLRKGVIRSPGGTCILKGDHYIIIDKNITKQEQIDIFIDCLKGFNMEIVYIKPEIRSLLRLD